MGWRRPRWRWMREHGEVLRASSPRTTATTRRRATRRSAPTCASPRPRSRPPPPPPRRRARRASPTACPRGTRSTATSTTTTSTPARGRSPSRSTCSSGPARDRPLARRRPAPRLRIWGWVRLTALAVEARLGPAADGLAAEALAWIGDRQRDLSRLILALDREAKRAAACRRVRGGHRPRAAGRDRPGRHGPGQRQDAGGGARRDRSRRAASSALSTAPPMIRRAKMNSHSRITSAAPIAP